MSSAASVILATSKLKFMHYLLICPKTKTKCLIGMGDSEKLRILWSDNAEVVGNMTKFLQQNAGHPVKMVNDSHPGLDKLEQVQHREPATRAKLHMSGKIGSG